EERVRERHRREDAGTLWPREPRGAPPVVAPRHHGAEEVRQLDAERDRFFDGDVDRRAMERRMAAHLSDGRAGEQLERHHRRHRIAGQAEPRGAVEDAEPNRGARAHAYAPEVERRAKPLEHLAYIV